MELEIARTQRHWWVFTLRGVLFIGLGIYMIVEPTGSFAALGFLFGLIIFLSGATELFRVTRERTQAGRMWHLILGIVEVILGLVLMGHIMTSMAILRIILGLYFLFRGFSLFTYARHKQSSWLLIAGAILIFIFGLLVLFDATVGDMTIILWTAIAFVITGLFNVVLGFALK